MDPSEGEPEPVGKRVKELLVDVTRMKDKTVKFRSILEKLQITLESIGSESDVARIVEQRKKLEQSQTETMSMSMIEQMESGRKLVLKCSKGIRLRNCFSNETSLQQKLEELNSSILMYFQLDKITKIARTVLEIEVQVEGTTERTEHDALKVCAAPEPPEFVVGLDDALNELKRQLIHEEEIVPMITVAGPPGSGKTTLAKMFCWDDEVKGKFKENIFYFLFGEKPKMQNLVGRLFQHNGLTVPKFQSEKDAVDQMKKLMEEIGKKGPVLIVLDDIWPGWQYLADNFVFCMPNYKVLVTSESKITRTGSLCVLEKLGETDATELFRYIAFENETRSEISDKMVKKIVDSCDGCPLALTMIGRDLKHQGVYLWRMKVRELEKGHKIQRPEYYTRIQSRYGLGTMPIERYKDLGLFPQDQRIPAAVLVDLWAELHSEDADTARKKISEMVDKDLADLIETRKVASDIVDKNYHYIAQQDRLRELGITETNEVPIYWRNRLIIEIEGNKLPKWWNVEKEYPIAARILSISTDDAFSSDWCNLQPTEVVALVLNLRQKKYTLPEFMKKMNKLKVLIITMYDFYPAELENFELLYDLPNLTRLWLENVSIPFLSKTGVQLNNLQKCSFYMCHVKKTFKNHTAQVSRKLPKLVEMEFDYCTMEELPVVLSDCVELKRLTITNCHKLSALPEEIGVLVNLELLNLRSCVDLKELPDSITSLKSLKFLDISECISLTQLPDDMGKLIKLEKLNVRGSGLTKLPTSISDLCNLQAVVCDEKMVDHFKKISSELQIHVAQAAINLDFLNNKDKGAR